MSTRSTLSGAKRALSSASTSASSRTCRLRASASTLAKATRDDGCDRKPVQLERERACVDSSELEEVVDEQRQRPYLLRSTGTYSSGPARPSSIASSIACMFASGVRRSWLAHATSSRRVSKSRWRLSPISLNDVARSASSVGPPLGHARLEVAARELRRTRRGPGRSTPRSSARGTSAATTAVSADAAVTARIFTSSPMWNITQPESEHRPEREQTARKARPASCSRTVGSRRRR